jgi:hypothetical protein
MAAGYIDRGTYLRNDGKEMGDGRSEIASLDPVRCMPLPRTCLFRFRGAPKCDQRHCGEEKHERPSSPKRCMREDEEGLDEM